MSMMDVSLKKVQLPNGESLGYREREGGEDVVVLVHGNMTSSKHWDLVLENMNSKYKVYAIDLRGFGVSTYLEPISSIKDFSDDLKSFLDALDLDDVALVGWSMGGAVCQQFCVDYPSYCNRLLLLASGSTRGYPFYATGENGLPDTNHRLKTYEEVKADPGKTLAVQKAYDTEDREFLKSMWNMLIYVNNKPDEEKCEEYVDDILTQRNLAEVYQALNQFNISAVDNEVAQGTGQAQDINIPVLVMRGDMDYVITEKMTNEILEDIGENTTFVSLPGCGHSPLVDDLSSLIQTLEQFLEEKEHHKQ
ncbi:intracellular short-chain-length polyhydroxyalkanoate depolymerase [Pontibacillus marinus]